MTDVQPAAQPFRRLNQRELEFGGLRFDVYFNGAIGATMRLSAPVDGEWKELLRFDDFVPIASSDVIQVADPQIPHDRVVAAQGRRHAIQHGLRQGQQIAGGVEARQFDVEVRLRQL